MVVPARGKAIVPTDLAIALPDGNLSSVLMSSCCLPCCDCLPVCFGLSVIPVSEANLDFPCPHRCVWKDCTSLRTCLEEVHRCWCRSHRCGLSRKWSFSNLLLFSDAPVNADNKRSEPSVNQPKVVVSGGSRPLSHGSKLHSGGFSKVRKALGSLDSNAQAQRNHAQLDKDTSFSSKTSHTSGSAKRKTMSSTDPLRNSGATHAHTPPLMHHMKHFSSSVFLFICKSLFFVFL